MQPAPACNAAAAHGSPSQTRSLKTTFGFSAASSLAAKGGAAAVDNTGWVGARQTCRATARPVGWEAAPTSHHQHLSAALLSDHLAASRLANSTHPACLGEVSVWTVKLISLPLGWIRGPGGPESGVNVLCSHARPYGWRRDNKMVRLEPVQTSLALSSTFFGGGLGPRACWGRPPCQRKHWSCEVLTPPFQI